MSTDLNTAKKMIIVVLLLGEIVYLANKYYSNNQQIQDTFQSGKIAVGCDYSQEYGTISVINDEYINPYEAECKEFLLTINRNHTIAALIIVVLVSLLFFSYRIE